MRLLIAKLASASAQSVSVAMNSEHDVADIATDLESCVRLLRNNDYDLVMLVLSHGRVRARDAIARMRREAGKVPLVVLTDSGEAGTAPLAGAFTAEPRFGLERPGLGHDGLGHDGLGHDGLGHDGLGHDGLGHDGLGHAKLEQAALERDSFRADATGWGWEARSELNGAAGQRASPGAASGARQMALLSLEPESETLRLDSQPLPLSQAEYRIFAALWERRGDIIPAHDLLEAIYRDGTRPTSRVLPVFLFKLRKKLRSAGLGEMIETAVGRGFTIRQPAPLALA